MDDRLGEILDRLRDLDRRIARFEQGGPMAGPPRPDEHGHGPPPGWHGGPPPGWRGGPPPGWHGGPPPGGHGGPRRHRGHGGEHHGCGDHHHGHHHHGCCHEGRRDHRDHGHGDHHGGDFEEKRVIDTVVRLTCENLAPIIASIVARELDRRAPPPPPPDPQAP